MKRLIIAQEALKNLEQLQNRLGVFKSDCEIVLNNIEQDEFLDKILAIKMQESIFAVLEIQENLEKIYAELSLGIIPKTIKDIKYDIENLSNELSEKGVYINAVKFFYNLHSSDRRTEELLADHKKDIDLALLEKCDIEKLKNDCQKFVDLQNLYNDKKGVLISVAQSFSEEIAMEITRRSNLYCAEESNIIEPKSQYIEEANVGNPVDSKYIEETIEKICEDVNLKEINPSDERVETVASPADISESYSVENVKEKTQQIKQDDAEKEEDLPEITIPIPRDAYSDVIISAKQIRFPNKEGKSVTATIIRNDCNRLIRQGYFDVAFSCFKEQYYCNGEIMVALRGKRFATSLKKSIEQLNNSFDAFNREGYVVKYDLGCYGNIYAISPRGLNALKCQDKKYSFSELVKKAKTLSENLEGKSNYASIALRNNAFKLINSINLSAANSSFFEYIGNGFESFVLSILLKDKVLVFETLIVSVCANTEKPFREVLLCFKDILKKAKADIVITIGFNAVQARALMEWLKECEPDYFSNNALLYYGLDTSELVFYHNNSAVTDFSVIADYVKELKNNDIGSNDNREEILSVTVDINEKHELKEENADIISSDEGTDNDSRKICIMPVEKLQNETSSTREELSENIIEQADASVQDIADSAKRNTISVIQNTEETILNPKDISEYLKKYNNILATGKIYCAVAYMKKLADIYPAFRTNYEQLAYAVNDPLACCNYTSGQISEKFIANGNGYNSFYMVSALLRNFYSNQYPFDYGIENLMGSVAEDELLSCDTDLKRLVVLFKNFKSHNRVGMGKFEAYRQNDTDELEKKLKSLSHKAANQKTLAIGAARSIDISNKRYYEARQLIFGKGSELSDYLDLAIKGEKDKDTVNLLQQYLADKFIKKDAEISADNIDRNKVEDVINGAWSKAGEMLNNKKVTSRLLGGVRNNVVHQIVAIVNILCDYYDAVGKLILAGKDDNLLPAYRKNCKEALEIMNVLIPSYSKRIATSKESMAEHQLLLYTLKEIKAGLESQKAEFSGKYFYLPFLETDNIILDDDYMPLLSDIKYLPDMTALKRIENHANSDSVSLLEKIKGIIDDDADIIDEILKTDNIGSLDIILNYIDTSILGFKEKFWETKRIDAAIDYARKDIKIKLKEFKDDLELRQSYGQIDNTAENKKENILQIAESLYDKACESNNFGFLKKVLREFACQIENDSKEQSQNLTRHLNAYLDEHKDVIEQKQVAKAVDIIKEYISLKKYASAEDMLNRLENGDLKDDFLEIEDYFEDFISQYENLLQQIPDNKRTLKSQIRIRMSDSKEKRGAERLAEAWPKGSTGVSENNLMSLLSHLGFKVDAVTKMDNINGKHQNFNVKLKKSMTKAGNNYRHPITAFGSLGATDGFRVVYVFGAYSAEWLIDIFNDIGDEKHTIVLLDYALKENVRRKLARLVKLRTNAKVYAVIDRVVIKYLINNYDEQSVNKRLMQIIMPYAYYQPYVADSSKAMPPEIFIGRKEELEKIKDPNGVNIVYGGRQLGKSALLIKAKNVVDKNESGDRAVYVDIKGLNYIQAAKKISQELMLAKVIAENQITENWDDLAFRIKARLLDEKNRIGYFLLLIDEADAFLESCKSIEFKPFDALKSIQTIGENRFKFVVAGLRDVIRFNRDTVLKNNTVLPHLSSLTVKPFKAAEARELLEYPLYYLGFRFERNTETDAMVSAIFSQTNYFPGMLQLYCTKLIEAMKNGYAGYDESSTPPYKVSESHIKKVLGEQSLQEEIRQKFFITLEVGEDNYYYLIALIIAYLINNDPNTLITSQSILEFAQNYGIFSISKLNESKVDALMKEMCELNVLQRAGGHGYRFARFSFLSMMGNKQSIEDELIKNMGDV